MYLLYNNLIEPVLIRLKPRVVVEIGSEFGGTTRKLIDFCEKTNAILHAVDPAPRFAAADWPERGVRHAIFHRTTGLDAVSKLDRFDAVLIDGDHNWYTVYNELKQIENRCASASQSFPLVMLHDIGWPYGRRDQYYDPERIPKEFRKPHAKKGMRFGMARLVETGGFNSAYWNALEEGGPHNGVLTAVEDFLGETGHQIRLIKFPGFHGLGILVPSHLEAKEELRLFFQLLELSPSVNGHIEGLEADRIDLTIRLQEAQPLPSRLSVWKNWVRHRLRPSIDEVRTRTDR